MIQDLDAMGRELLCTCLKQYQRIRLKHVHRHVCDIGVGIKLVTTTENNHEP